MIVRRFFLPIFLPIFLYASQEAILNSAHKLDLHNTNEWKSLLHFNGYPDIDDEKFILSKSFSLKNEIDATIVRFYDNPEKYPNINNHAQCRFPARLLFITHELNISKSEFPEIHCPDLETYTMKAPADTISVIYASENVKNPSSMMGHTFLKLSGKNFQGRNVDHAITFYTLLETFNVPLLVYQNIYSGMNGQFLLQPYKTPLEQYTHTENRNVWEFHLELSEYKNKLIYYHMFELKDINMKYYFSNYNCATIIYYALSLANPSIYNEKKIWVTPLDIVKILHKYHLVSNREIQPSDEWLIKMFNENVSSEQIKMVTDIVAFKQFDKIKHLDFFSLKLLDAYVNFNFKEGILFTDEFTIIKQHLTQQLKQNNNSIDISNYKSPEKIPSERQLSTGFNSTNESNSFQLSFLPASHLLNDDNREYFGESELKISHLSVLLKKNNIDLKEFTLYGMKSYIPYDTLTHDISSQFQIGVFKEYTKDMHYASTAKIDAGVGVDFAITHDVNFFAILNTGVGYNNIDGAHLFLNPQLGTMIYEVFNMKSLLFYQPLFANNDKVYDKFVFNHSIFLKGCKLYFNIEEIKSEMRYRNFEFGFSKMF